MAGTPSKECQNIVLSGIKKMLIAPLGVEKTAARDVGFTNGNVTLTAAFEYADVMVDQSLLPVRRIATAVNYNFAAPLASMSLDNLAIGLGVVFGPDGQATLAQERYYQVWLETDGPVNDEGKKAVREIYFPKIALGGTTELAFSRTDAQTANLEGVIINCPTKDGNANFLQITDNYTEAA